MAQSEKRHLGGIILPQQSAPSNPPSAHATLYVGTDGEFHWRTPAGTDQPFLLGQSPVYVTHGATAGTARPNVGTRPVVWRGSVQPTNWTSVDIWEDTTGSGGGSGSITYAAPVTQNPDVANTEGSATTVARSDHIHNIPADTAVGLTFASTNTEGASTSFARANHTHAITAFDATTPAALTPDIAAATGAATVAARRDHVHNVPAGVAVGLSATTANAEGTAADFARSDHTHAIGTAAPAAALTSASTNAVGTAVTLARSDHSHAVTFFDATAPAALAPDIAAAVGSATVAARRDHVHNVPSGPAVGISFVTTNTEGTAADFARADHTHAIAAFDATAPATVSPDTAAAAGTALVAARRDHVHGIAVGDPVTINITETTLHPGVANSVARSDHVHTATGFVGLSQFNWFTYTPLLRNNTTNVAKTVVSARYMWVGDLVIVTMRCDVTASGVAGDMLLGLPVLPQAADRAIGMASHYDASANTAYSGIAFSHTAVGGTGAVYFVRDNTVSNVAHGTALGSGDVVWLNCQYEAA